MRAAMRPPLVYVMGPSGAGKDTLLRAARARLEGGDVFFAHRYITRDPVPGDENFIALSPAEFEARTWKVCAPSARAVAGVAEHTEPVAQPVAVEE